MSNICVMLIMYIRTRIWITNVHNTIWFSLYYRTNLSRCICNYEKVVYIIREHLHILSISTIFKVINNIYIWLIHVRLIIIFLKIFLVRFQKNSYFYELWKLLTSCYVFINNFDVILNHLWYDSIRLLHLFI